MKYVFITITVICFIASVGSMYGEAEKILIRAINPWPLPLMAIGITSLSMI